MDSLTYPDNWDTLVLKPGESVSVTGTLKGVKEGETHTDRAIVTGTPLVECAPSNGDPFNDKTDGGEDTDPEYSTGDVTEIDGKQLCADTQTASNTDDWNGYREKPLASTRSRRARPCRRRSDGATRGRLPARVPQAPLRTGFRPPHGRERGQVTPWRSGLVVR